MNARRSKIQRTKWAEAEQDISMSYRASESNERPPALCLAKQLLDNITACFEDLRC